MFVAVFRNFLVLFFCCLRVTWGQSVDNVAVIELSDPNFSIERPYTISVLIPNSENRPTLTFPDLPGFTKKGITTSTTPTEVGDKTVVSQIITQSYQARAPGTFRIPPFSLVVNGTAIQSAGAVLIVRPSATASASVASTLTASVGKAAFLALRTSRSTVYVGEGVALTLSFFVADAYPYVLNFVGVNQQLQAILKQIRLPNTWEENLPIQRLEPVSVGIGGKKFREYRLYQSVFFPLSTRPLQLPAVSLRLLRQRPVIGPPSAQPESIVFSSAPVSVAVRPLPTHPLRGRLPVGRFRLEESVDRPRISAGQSVRYTFGIVGEGNIATLPAPTLTSETKSDVDVFPPQEQHSVNHGGSEITGRKTFAYFLVPHQNGTLSLANSFQWIYFDPQTARYDTLRSSRSILVGSSGAVPGQAVTDRASTSVVSETPVGTTSDGRSIYTGIDALDSSDQPVNSLLLIRTIANVLIVLMLLGMIFIFLKR